MNELVPTHEIVHLCIEGVIGFIGLIGTIFLHLVNKKLSMIDEHQTKLAVHEEKIDRMERIVETRLEITPVEPFRKKIKRP